MKTLLLLTCSLLISNLAVANETSNTDVWRGDTSNSPQNQLKELRQQQDQYNSDTRNNFGRQQQQNQYNTR